VNGSSLGASKNSATGSTGAVSVTVSSSMMLNVVWNPVVSVSVVAALSSVVLLAGRKAGCSSESTVDAVAPDANANTADITTAFAANALFFIVLPQRFFID
jgi:hypothetical protein